MEKIIFKGIEPLVGTQAPPPETDSFGPTGRVESLSGIIETHKTYYYDFMNKILCDRKIS